jgi:hypothetical protein
MRTWSDFRSAKVTCEDNFQRRTLVPAPLQSDTIILAAFGTSEDMPLDGQGQSLG